MRKHIIFIMILQFVAVSVWAQTKKGEVLIKNATVITITDGTRENTDVYIKDGKIAGIGKDLSASSNATVVDATGQYVMPGIIDAHSHIALDAVNEATSPVTAQVWVGDALDPFDVSIYRALAGGVTISHSMHGSANAIGGQNETIKHRWGTVKMDELRMEGAPRTIKFALGENPTRVHGTGNNIVPRTRMGVEQVFRRAFSEAKEYLEKWDEYNANKNKRGYKGMAPEYDLQKEVIADILRGEIIVHCHSYRADEILMLMDVFKDYGIKKLVFQHVNEGFKVAPEIAEFGAMASVFADWWAYKFEVYYSTAYNAAILTKNGVTTSINSDSGELIRHLFHEAAKTQKYGDLTDDEALKLITLNPAKQLGIDDRVGSLEVGKDGDVVIFKNHPLSIYAVPQMTFVDGVKYFDINEDQDDMRIYVDPSEEIDVMRSRTEHEKCMANAEWFLTN
ncbi:amidohydrolase [Christiangramia sabulilitoris]|uniref:Amidohydrolase n=1 Tax=Christiangramia sabulilitoris TaxID=2583991 RepID=A0A550I2F8_9FLAO|nr:amidohydrolase [Christiangramia sabulilitoris]TRO65156.1 amidohydrolase [Christiangramia sabulilitoris]